MVFSKAQKGALLPGENALMRLRSAGLVGVLRLRECFALRSIPFAQDDRTAEGWVMVYLCAVTSRVSLSFSMKSRRTSAVVRRYCSSFPIRENAASIRASLSRFDFSFVLVIVPSRSTLQLGRI